MDDGWGGNFTSIVKVYASGLGFYPETDHTLIMKITRVPRYISWEAVRRIEKNK